ncbi:MAG: hypothetical protein IJU46_02560 [Clostridia bacterium]|nr:hypothetical protein [Clostridia bacterium]
MRNRIFAITARVIAACVIFAVAICPPLAAVISPVCAAVLPARYITPAVTPVLDQKNKPLCWAYSCADLLSINAAVRGYAPGGRTVFSPAVIARAEFDGLEHRNSGGRNWYDCTGGTDYALIAGAAGKGIRYQSDIGSVAAAAAMPQAGLYQSSGYVDEYRTSRFSYGTREEAVRKIKTWVAEFGAVGIVAQPGSAYDSATGVATFDRYDSSKYGHAMLIVGWDDGRAAGSGTGAFRVKNTWGEGWGDGGYAWVSYETSFGDSYYTASVRTGDAAEDFAVLSHTETASLSGSTGAAAGGDIAAVSVYTAAESLTVSEAGFYTSKRGTEAHIRVWAAKGGVADILARDPDAEASGSFDDEGYYLLKLDRELELKAGDTVVSVTTLTSGGVTFVCSEYSDPDFGLAVTSAAPGGSYMLSGGKLRAAKGDWICMLAGRASGRPAAATGEVTAAEVTAPDITASGDPTADVTTAGIPAADVTTSDTTSSEVTAPDVTTAVITSSGAETPGSAAAVVTAADVTAADVTAADVTAADVTAADAETEPDDGQGSLSFLKTAGIIALAAVAAVNLLVILAVELSRRDDRKKKKK